MLRSKPQYFDVLCAGDAFLRVAEGGLHSAGGAIGTALELVRQEVTTALVTVVADDRDHRALVSRIEARGIDVRGVALVRPTRNLVFVRGGARQVLSARDEELPFSLPEDLSAKVVVLSGVSPVVAHGASLCKAARAARRAGSTVVLDVNARWNLWQGHDSRAICMLLREVDVVSCTAQDLFAIGMGLPELRASMRTDAVLVWSDGMGTASASGSFGEITRGGEKKLRTSELVTAAVAAELVRTTTLGDELWSRALGRALK
ncbi:hypothetical protein BH09MYX1_BH09MYX1_19690 [soil metagenome]